MDVSFDYSKVVLCPRCGSRLVAQTSSTVARKPFSHEKYQCEDCASGYSEEDEILRLLDSDRLHSESHRELNLRDEQAGGSRKWRSLQDLIDDEHQAMEVLPTLEWLSLSRRDDLLELGCGDGRYTRFLAVQVKSLMAVDLSLRSLLCLRTQLDVDVAKKCIGLVQADACSLKLVPRSFDVAFSTLVSNLPTPDHRVALYRLAAESIRPHGRFVFSVHQHSFRDRMLGVAKSGRYAGGGIYRYQFSAQELESEIGRFFEWFRIRPIRTYVPLSRRFGLRPISVSRFAERVPLLGRLALLLLCEARRPKIEGGS
jgi:SAM-dependent methyltransferase